MQNADELSIKVYNYSYTWILCSAVFTVWGS